MYSLAVHLTPLAEADHKQGEKDEKIEKAEQERQLKINFRSTKQSQVRFKASLFSAFETDSQFRTEFQKKEVLDFRN